MAKVTLYHPVSLNTIRAAAENCGFVLGRIVCLARNVTEGWATYHSLIINAPIEFGNFSQLKQINVLNECYAEDVVVTWCGVQRDGRLSFYFTTSLSEPAYRTAARVSGQAPLPDKWLTPTPRDEESTDNG